MRTLPELVTAFVADHDEIVWADGTMTRRTMPALLDVLDDLKRSSSGRGAARGVRSDGSPRPDPLDLERVIRHEVTAHYLDLTLPRTRYHDLKGLLPAWLDAYMAIGPTLGEIVPWQERLVQWADDIIAMYDPQQSQEIMADCTICGQYRVTVHRDGDTREVQALRFTYREGAIADTAQLACAECGPIVEGMRAVEKVAHITRATA